MTAHQHAGAVKRAEKDGGSVVKLPTSVADRIVTPIHAAAVAIPALVYLVINALEQPDWMQSWRLPYIGIGEEAWSRTAACAACLGLSAATGATINYLGKQWYYIGVSIYLDLIIRLNFDTLHLAPGEA
jgi:hypothetical protein